MTLRSSSLLAAAVLCAFGSGIADAATITQNFDTGPFTVSNAMTIVVAINAAQFNPALGTLTSVSDSYSGRYTEAGGTIKEPDTVSFDTYIVSTDGLASSQDTDFSAGTYRVSATASTSAAVTLAAVTGTGSTTLYFTAYADLFDTSTGFPVTLTYTYTPATVTTTPEPTSISLLGTGLLGLTGLIKRRLA